jgi:hypothetical protein
VNAVGTPGAHAGGDGRAFELRALVDQSVRRSAVFDVVTGTVPVTVEVTTG